MAPSWSRYRSRTCPGTPLTWLGCWALGFGVVAVERFEGSEFRVFGYGALRASGVSGFRGEGFSGSHFRLALLLCSRLHAVEIAGGIKKPVSPHTHET